MRILLVDDHAMVREGLRVLIEREPDMHVLGDAVDGHDAIAQALDLSPSIVVMDISLPCLNGVEATRRIVEALPGVKVISLSMNADRRYVRAMFEAGASGYLLKNAASDELLRAIRAVAQNRTYVSSGIASVVVEGFLRGGPSGQRLAPPDLSAREREVLQLLAEGKTSKEIAAILNVAASTVETHRRQIMDKLGLRSVAALTKYAIRNGLTSLE